MRFPFFGNIGDFLMSDRFDAETGDTLNATGRDPKDKDKDKGSKKKKGFFK